MKNVSKHKRRWYAVAALTLIAAIAVTAVAFGTVAAGGSQISTQKPDPKSGEVVTPVSAEQNSETRICYSAPNALIPVATRRPIRDPGLPDGQRGHGH